MAKTLDQTVALPQNLKDCHELIGNLLLNIEELKARLKIANIKLFGSSSERMKSFDEYIDKKFQDILAGKVGIQTELFSDIEAEFKQYVASNQEPSQESNGKEDLKKLKEEAEDEPKKKRKAKEAKLKNTESLEVVECHHGNDLSECPCCRSQNLSEIGTKSTQEIEIIPAKVIVKEHIVHKIKCNDCSKIHSGNKPLLPLNKCMASASLLAYIAYYRFGMYSTYYRLAEDLRSKGLDISEVNLCNWMINLSEDIFYAVYLALVRSTKNTDVLFADETVLKELRKGGCKIMYVWCYTNPKNKNIVLEYSTRSREAPNSFLKDFSNAFLVTDKYAGYDPIAKLNNIKRCYCWVHARRNFYKILKACDSPNQLPEIKNAYVLISNMLKKDREIRAGEKDLIVASRKEHILPMITAIYAYLEMIRGIPNYSLSKPIINAVDYVLTSKEEFKAFVNHSDIEPSNNLSERNVRFLTIGRKNWMFAGSERGGKTIAVISSIIASAKQYKLNIMDYLTHLIKNVPSAKQSEIDSFLPQNCLQFQMK